MYFLTLLNYYYILHAACTVCIHTHKIELFLKYYQEEIFNLSSETGAEPMLINQTQTAFWSLDPGSNPLLVAASSATSPRHGRCINKITVEVILGLDMQLKQILMGMHVRLYACTVYFIHCTADMYTCMFVCI